MGKYKPTKEDIETYRRNTVDEIDYFCSCLKEVQQDEPSVPGRMCGMDYQQMAAATIFHFIIQQEEYADGVWKDTSPFSTEEQKKLLDCMVTAAKLVFGEEEYERWYKSRKSPGRKQ